MLTPVQIRAIPTAALDAFAELESALKVTAATALADPLSADRAAIRAVMAANSSSSARGIETVIFETMADAARASLLADEELYAAARVAGLVAPYAPVADSVVLKAVLDRGVVTASTMLNLTRTSAEQAIAAGFLDALDGAVLSIATGAAAPNAAIRAAIDKIARSTTNVSYITADGVRIKQSLYGAVRRAVLTGTHQTTLRMQETRLAEVGAEYVEITAHSGARPDHAEWQGTVIKLSDLEEVTGYGSGEGLGGWN